MAAAPKRVINMSGVNALIRSQSEIDAAAAAAGDAAYKSVLAAHGVAANQATSDPAVRAAAQQASAQASAIAHASATSAGLSAAAGSGAPPQQIRTPDLHINTQTGDVTANPTLAERWHAASMPVKAGVVAVGALVLGKLTGVVE